jgi:hypothetical protein
VIRLLGLRHHSDGLLTLVGALAAAGFHPLRVVMRGGVDQMLFGDRPDPLDAATLLADRVGDDPALALRAIREALVLPYASSGGHTGVLADGFLEVIVALACIGTAITLDPVLKRPNEGMALGFAAARVLEVAGLPLGRAGITPTPITSSPR